YNFIIYFFKFLFRSKKTPPMTVDTAVGGAIENDAVRSTYGYSSAIIEVQGIDLFSYSEERQDHVISSLANVLKQIKHGKLVKLDMPFDFTKYIDKYEHIIAEYKERINNGAKDKDALETKIQYLENQLDKYRYLNADYHYTGEKFYLIVFAISIEEAKDIAENIAYKLSNIGIQSTMLNELEINEFYNTFYTDDPDDSLIVLPSVKETTHSLIFDDDPTQKYRIGSIARLPMYCDNAWLYNLFSIEHCRIVLNFDLVDENAKTIKAINRSIVELQSRYDAKGTTESTKQDIENSIAALQELLSQLKLDNEGLHKMSCYVLYEASRQKEIVEAFHESNMYFDGLFCRQYEAYCNMNLFTPQIDYKVIKGQEVQSSTLAASIPFIFKAFIDEKGDYLGYNRYPVFFDLFKSWGTSDNKRTNANMSVLGKSGGGKSYFLKKLQFQ
ncbi:MAG: hypothetical protein HUJ68_06020, partial [Clostridia bacterium]|nr:hypothetical protein [Clostridia bacterium]